MFLDRHGHFFRTRTRHNVAVARRYLRGLAQAEDCTFESMAAVVEGGCPQQFQHFISCSPWDHEPVVAQIGKHETRLAAGWNQHASPTAILVAVGVINPRGRFRGNSIPIASSLRPEARGIKMLGSSPRAISVDLAAMKSSVC